jgi:hypothetical protein
MGQVRPIVPHRLTSLAQRDHVGGETPGSRATRRGRRTPRHVRLPSDLRRVVDRGGSPAPLPAASARGASTARKRTRSPIGSSAWIHRARGGLPFRPIGRDMCFEASADRLTLGICASSLAPPVIFAGSAVAMFPPRLDWQTPRPRSASHMLRREACSRGNERRSSTLRLDPAWT